MESILNPYYRTVSLFGGYNVPLNRSPTENKQFQAVRVDSDKDAFI